jgi:chromosome segregation protein
LGERIAAAEREMDDARLLQQTALSQTERIESRIALGAERRAGAVRTAETLARDLALLEEEKVRQQSEGEARAVEAREAEARLADLAKELASAESVAAEAERALIDLSRTVAGQQADYLELARRLSAQKAELAAVRARIAQRAADVHEAELRVETRQTEAESARAAAETLSAETESARAALEEARRVLTGEREPARLKTTEAVTALAEQRTVAERQLAGEGARLRALEETEAAQEGYFGGVKSVVRAANSGRLSGSYTLVADALRVPAHLDTAIEIALGASLQDVITDTEAEAKAAISFLNETRGGRATFLPLNALRDQEVPDGLRKAARQFSGVLGSAADLVGHDAHFAPAVLVLLARVLITDDLDTATKVARQIERRDWAKIVTQNGEVVVPTGAITGGSQGRPGPNLLGRKREIGELTRAVKAGRDTIESLKNGETEAKAAAEAARLAVREAEAAVSRARDAVGDAERRAQAKTAEADRLMREAETLRQRVQSLRDSGDSDRTREEVLASALAAADAQDEGMEATREELQRRQAALAVRRDEAQRTARTLSGDLASLRERARTLARDADRAHDASLRAALSVNERLERATEAQSIIAAEDREAETRETERERAKVALADAAALLQRWRDARQALLTENFALAEKIKAATRAAGEQTEQAQAARLRSARLEAQAEVIGQRLLDEYDLHPESAVALTGGIPVDKDTAQEIARLRREIKGLGAVNVGAIEEYERLSERWRFLTEQQKDLEEAKERLTAAIADIDESTRGVFLETFQKVSYAFSRLFSRLFGGGTTELVLTNPDDLFETGIDIIAQPPGKKRQSLSLLSGGERALTATALLFAFLEVHPAPFCVLDEVDAPLDGANVEKYADLLRDFGRDSQFIVITHNATTMEAAPLWYGITMQEPGISRGISMKVPESASESVDGAVRIK